MEAKNHIPGVFKAAIAVLRPTAYPPSIPSYQILAQMSRPEYARKSRLPYHADAMPQSGAHRINTVTLAGRRLRPALRQEFP
jgi:hypothetical protein